MEQPEKKQEIVHARQWVIKEQHYKTASEWLERLGLVVIASVVIQKIVSGASLSDPVVIIGSMCALVIYAGAIILLLRS
jgi:hypothetical protein